MDVKKNLDFVTKYLKGEFQSMLGLDITSTPTSRLALNQWISKTNKNNIQGKELLITAFRNHTWIEWAAYAACVFKNMGYNSTLLYRKSEVDKFYTESPSLLNFWSGVKNIPGIKLVDVESASFDKPTFDRFLSLPDEYYAAATAYDFHVEKEDILNNLDPEYAPATKALKIKTAQVTSVLQELYKKNKYHRFFLYSGIISDSRGAMDITRENNQELVCIEGWSWRSGHVIYNYNAPALEYNVRGWMNSLGAWNDQKEKEINSYIKFLDGEKVNEPGWLDNFYLVQRSKINADFSKELNDFIQGDQPIAVLAPNVIGDSSLLNRETIFPSLRTWMKTIIEYFKNNPDKKLIIRAHPAEVWVAEYKLKIRIGELAQELSKGIPNIFILDGRDKTNTFSLLPYARVGLIWLSSVGFDMVIRGLPVIAAAEPKYSGLGIVEEPKSKEEYFQLLEKFMTTQHRPAPEQIQKGKEFQYMVFKGFSFQAQGTSYRADSCRLGNMPNQEEHDRFYKILVGEAPAPDLVNA
jgi:hypothetical protein